MELVFGAAGLAVAIVALAVTMVAILISLWLRFNSVVSRVRTAENGGAKIDHRSAVRVA